MASLAQLEGQIMAARLSKGRRRKAAQGGYVGGWLPYGYRYVEGAVAAVPEEAEAVRRIFEARAAGMAYEKIAWQLTTDRIPTQRGGTWRISTVRRIVFNRFYAGLTDADGESVQGQHEAVVSRELFQRVAARGRRTTRGTHASRPSTSRTALH